MHTFLLYHFWDGPETRSVSQTTGDTCHQAAIVSIEEGMTVIDSAKSDHMNASALVGLSRQTGQPVSLGTPPCVFARTHPSLWALGMPRTDRLSGHPIASPDRNNSLRSPRLLLERIRSATAATRSYLVGPGTATTQQQQKTGPVCRDSHGLVFPHGRIAPARAAIRSPTA